MNAQTHEAISQKYQALMVAVCEKGPRAGWDSIFGQGAYDQMVSDLYDEITAK